MPIFGLVWVASWVNCFFSSSQDLLRLPSYLAHALPNQTATQRSGVQNADNHPDMALSVSSSKRLLGQSMQPYQPVSSSAVLLPFDADVPFPPLGLLGVFRGLFSGFQKLTASNHPLPVLVKQVNPAEVLKASVAGPSPAGLGFGQCLPVVQNRTRPTAHLSGGRSPKDSLFQVTVKGHVVSAAPKQQQAMQIAYRLEQMLGDTKPPLQQLQPGIVNGVPVGKIGDRVLFTVDGQVAAQWNCTAEMLAIQWINGLRTAVAQPPLTLADAQAKMYGLQSTGQFIEGLASWYGPYFHGRQTATGEMFNQNDYTAAHPSLPFDTFLKVTNVENGKSVVVRINDRGPYFENRTLDLSREAARCLGSETAGVVAVEAEIMQPAIVTAPAHQTIAQRL